VRVITIDFKEDWSTVKAYAKNNPCLFLLDETGSVMSDYYQNGAVPLNYVIKPNPQVVYDWMEGFSESQIRSWINACLPGVEEDTKCEIQNAKLAVSPNPFNRRTVIKCLGLGISKEQEAEIKIYDVGGRVIRTLRVHNLQSPITEVTWDGEDNKGMQVPTGIYFCRFSTHEVNLIEKLIIVK
jgi:hypothetical protein